MKVLKSNVTQKSISFLKLLKLAAFVIFPTSIMVLFELKGSKVSFSMNYAFPLKLKSSKRSNITGNKS